VGAFWNVKGDFTTIEDPIRSFVGFISRSSQCPLRSADGWASGHSSTSGKLKSGRWFQQRFGGLLSDSSAAYPVVKISDLPAPKQPLPPRDRLAARWRTFRESAHTDSTRSRHWSNLLHCVLWANRVHNSGDSVRTCEIWSWLAPASKPPG